MKLTLVMHRIILARARQLLMNSIDRDFVTTILGAETTVDDKVLRDFKSAVARFFDGLAA